MQKYEFAPPRLTTSANGVTEMVLDMLDNRPAHYTFKFIAQHTGINAYRVQHLANRRGRDMYAHEMLTLYEFFTGKQLEY